MSVRSRPAWIWGLAALTAAGAALRFATLSVQSFWLDEAVTHQLVTKSLGGMLDAIPHSESTPPLYYVVAWLWVRVFGAGEAGLRSLSALLGTATIVVLALIARRLAGERAALAAAALAATNPLLIWYSQEARAYMLLVLLCALTVWCLLRSDWRGWALAAALALATHYFAVFVVVPEIAWLAIVHARRSRSAALAVGGVLVVGAALLPLAVVQAGQGRAAFIHASSLGTRIAEIPKQFLIGYAAPYATVLTIVAVALAVALAAQLRGSDRGMLALAALAVGVPVVLAPLGADYVITRNVIVALVPLIALAGVAVARTRIGPLLAAGICAAGIAAFVGVEATPADQRDDWRGVAKAIGRQTVGPRVVIVDPASGVPALQLYMPSLRRITQTSSPSVAAREIDVIDVARQPPDPATPIPLPGFTTSVVHTETFTLVRYLAPAAITEGFVGIASRALVPASGPALLRGS